VQRVNDIRAGRAAAHFLGATCTPKNKPKPSITLRTNDNSKHSLTQYFVDAPFDLQPGESYILQGEKFEFNQVVPPKILKAVIPGGGWANQPSLVPPHERTEGETELSC
jgi:hypothetical protein